MAHLHEKIDFTTSVYIVREGKVLLHKHKKLGILLPPGGHIELNEDPNQAALREAKEESGLDIELVGNPSLSTQPNDGSQDLIPPMFINRHHFNETHEHVDLIYFGRVVDGEVKSEEGGGEIGWFSKEEVQKMDLKNAIRLYALSALTYFRNRE